MLSIQPSKKNQNLDTKQPNKMVISQTSYPRSPSVIHQQVSETLWDCVKESRTVLRDYPYEYDRLYILKSISIHFTWFNGSTSRTSSLEVRSTQCTKKEKQLWQKINPVKLDGVCFIDTRKIRSLDFISVWLIVVGETS